MVALSVAASLAVALPTPALAAAPTAPLELIIAPDTFVTALLPLKDWREQQGLRVDIVTTTFVSSLFPAYDLPESINAYIGARYASDRSLKYVLLAADDPIIPGRALQVANRTAGPTVSSVDRAVVSDYYYAFPGQSWINYSDRGDDYPVGLTWFGIRDANWSLAPVLSVGRIPAANVSQLSSYVTRLLTWEKTPPSGPWQSRAIMGLGVASVPDGTFSTRRLGDDAAVAFSSAEARLTAAGLADISLPEYPGWPSPYDALADRLDAPTFLGEWNLGASVALLAARDGPVPGAPGEAYSGDGTSSVFTPVATPAGLADLANGGKLPIFVAAYGGSANFSMDNGSNIENALFAPNGGAALAFGFTGRTSAGTQPGGALGGWTEAAALVDALVSSPGRAGDVLDGVRARFVSNAQAALGGAFDSNNASLRRAVAGLTLLGDPGSLLKAGPQGTLEIVAPAGVAPNATTTFTIQVSSGGAPVAGATVAVVDDLGDLQANCTTDSTGSASCSVAAGPRATWTIHVSAAGFAMATVALAVDAPPTTAIFTPVEGSSIAGRLNFTGAAGDPDAADHVTAVEVALNGGPWMAALGGAAWSFEVDTELLPNGPNSVAARASDGVVWGAARTATFNVTNPKTPTLAVPYGDLVLNEDESTSFALDLDTHFTATGPGATFDAAADTTDPIAVVVVGPSIRITPLPNFAGTAHVGLRVFESYGGSLAVNLTIRVRPVDDPPQITVTQNFTVEEGGTVNFDPRAIDPDGTSPTLYIESGPQNATPTGWTAPRGSEGTFDIVIAATDGRYIARATVTVTVTSHNSPPTAKMVGPSSGEAGRELSFEAQLLTDSDGDDITVLWDFGDGQVSHGRSVSHVYAAPGSYTVTLTASDGREDTVLVGAIRINPYTPLAAGPSSLATLIAYASIAVIIACAMAASYLLFFSRGRAQDARRRYAPERGDEEE